MCIAGYFLNFIFKVRSKTRTAHSWNQLPNLLPDIHSFLGPNQCHSMLGLHRWPQVTSSAHNWNRGSNQILLHDTTSGTNFLSSGVELLPVCNPRGDVVLNRSSPMFLLVDHASFSLLASSVPGDTRHMCPSHLNLILLICVASVWHIYVLQSSSLFVIMLGQKNATDMFSTHRVCRRTFPTNQRQFKHDMIQTCSVCSVIVIDLLEGKFDLCLQMSS